MAPYYPLFYFGRKTNSPKFWSKNLGPNIELITDIKTTNYILYKNRETKFGALIGGLNPFSAPHGSKADSLGSDWTKLDSAVDPTWVELWQI